MKHKTDKEAAEWFKYWKVRQRGVRETVGVLVHERVRCHMDDWIRASVWNSVRQHLWASAFILVWRAIRAQTPFDTLSGYGPLYTGFRFDQLQQDPIGAEVGKDVDRVQG